MKKLDYFVGKILEYLTTLCLIVTVVITLLQVIFRYVLESPLTWSQEILMMFFVYSIFFGSALATRNGDHLEVDLLDNASEWVKRFTEVLRFVVVGIMIVLLTVYGFMLVRDNFVSGQMMATVEMQKAYVYLALPISGLFMLYYHMKKVIEKCFGS
ncbi:TRAP transporter small permease subunit [Pontibacillus yanchengensis]|uniref:TRAP transporter small permease subunit n=2 Tax=Pontibacillus yanchengensis TaxID=462910 RepID=A0ACC7VI99_9BACI|nr:TRAP transporter small permease [Pontibacillus yanchengensis]MYL33870.1 TRAP transporter small permease subunit [Pontibacillus yanchengensis]MYL53896.1 TRAP transporter small permease subunit [Pontibacillus yanchengensis]